MTKVLFVDHTPFVGGAQLVLVEHIKALDKTRIEPHVACTDTVPELVERFDAAGAHVHVVAMPRLRQGGVGSVRSLLQAARQLRSLVKREQIGVVVANSTRASYMATLAVIGLRTKLIWWVRDFLYPIKLFALLKWRAWRIIFVSQAVKNHYMRFGDPKGLVWYVASNIYQKLEQVPAVEIRQLRRSLGFADTDVVVGFMGRLVAEKGAQDVVAAVAQLASQLPQLRLLIVGTGAGQEHDIEPELRHLVEEQHLQSSVAFAGYQTNEALYYSAFDVFVLATRDHEPYATSVVQAMMAGKAVVGTAAGGTPELVVDHQTGLLYPPGDVKKLAELLRQLVIDPDLRHKLGQQGQRRVLESNREDQLARTAEILYDQAVVA